MRWSGRGDFDPEEYKDISADQIHSVDLNNTMWYHEQLGHIVQHCSTLGNLQKVVTEVIGIGIVDPWAPIDMFKPIPTLAFADTVKCLQLVDEEFKKMDRYAGDDWWSFATSNYKMNYATKLSKRIFAQGLYNMVGTLHLATPDTYKIKWDPEFNRNRIRDVATTIGGRFIEFVASNEITVSLDEYYTFMAVMCMTMHGTIFTRIPPHKFKCLPLVFSKCVTPVDHDTVDADTKAILTGLNMDQVFHVLDSKHDDIKCGYCGKSEKLLRCTKCKLASYCNRECQKKDWPSHKMSCNSNLKESRSDLPVIIVNTSQNP